MNGFRKMQQQLQEAGWYVAWALPCCQSCAWESIPLEHEDGPFKGQDIDLDRVLFNHEQDCQLECEYDEEADKYILPEGMTEDDYSTFPHTTPEEQSSSLFSFSATEQGVKNLISVLPIIKEAGCTVRWNKNPNSRIQIIW